MPKKYKAPTVPPSKIRPPDYGEPGMPREPGMKQDLPAEAPVTDADIQRTSDMITQRSPYEESEVREPYGPEVPVRPMNIARFMTRSREAERGQPPTHGRSKARVKLNEMTEQQGGTEPFDSERPYIERSVAKFEGAGAVGGGKAIPPAWHRHMKRASR